MIYTLLEAALANTTDVVLTYDDTSKRVTVSSVRCVKGGAKGTKLELRGDIARMFGYLDNTSIRASNKKGFTLALPKLEINIFMFIDNHSKYSHGLEA